MKRNHFLIAYAGNKRTEVENIYKQMSGIINDITTIIEPFCGSSAVSYYISLQHPLKFKYILNDNNINLVKLYEIARDPVLLDELIIKLNIMSIDINKEKYLTFAKNLNIFENWLYINKIYCLRAGLFPNDGRKIVDFNSLKKCPIINFLIFCIKSLLRLQ